MVRIPRVLFVVVVVASLSGCAPAASSGSVSYMQSTQSWPECGATIIYEPDGTSGLPSAEEALSRHLDWLTGVVANESREPEHQDSPGRAPELEVTEAALAALDGSGAGNVSRLDTHRRETVMVEAVGVDGARIGTVVLQEDRSGFTIDTVEIAPRVSPSNPAC